MFKYFIVNIIKFCNINWKRVIIVMLIVKIVKSVQIYSTCKYLCFVLNTQYVGGYDIGE